MCMLNSINAALTDAVFISACPLGTLQEEQYDKRGIIMMLLGHIDLKFKLTSKRPKHLIAISFISINIQVVTSASYSH